jgi:hypothetical protein
MSRTQQQRNFVWQSEAIFWHAQASESADGRAIILCNELDMSLLCQCEIAV